MSGLSRLRRLEVADLSEIKTLLGEAPLLRTLVSGFLSRDAGSAGTLLASGALFGAPEVGPLGTLVYRSAAGLVIPVAREPVFDPQSAVAIWGGISPVGPIVVLGAEGHVAALIAAAAGSHEVAFDLVQQVMEREGVPSTASSPTPSELQLRLAEPADLMQVVTLVADHQREELGLSVDRSPSGGLARRLRDRIERRWCVLGFLGEEPVTHVAASVCSPDGAQLEAIYTVPVARGRSYAAKALERLGDELARQGAGRVSLVVAPGNEAACRLYTRLGLTIRGRVRFVRLVPRGAGP